MGSWIAPEFVGDQSPRRLALALQHFAKESLGNSLVPAFSDQDIQNIAILIHCSPEVKLLTLNLHEDFINMPSVTQSTPLTSDRAGVFRSKLETPEADGLVGDDDLAFSQQILDISKAQGESMVEPHGMADDFTWEPMSSIQ